MLDKMEKGTTVKEFKEKYPQYAHLEGDELWDMMTEVVYEECGSPKGLEKFDLPSDNMTTSFGMVIWDVTSGDIKEI